MIVYEKCMSFEVPVCKCLHAGTLSNRWWL